MLLQQEKYKSLLSNTAIFALSSMMSKLLVFLIMRHYTEILSPAEYSVADRIITTSDLLMPFVMVSTSDAIFRFTLDDTKKAQIYDKYALFLHNAVQIKVISVNYNQFYRI